MHYILIVLLFVIPASLFVCIPFIPLWRQDRYYRKKERKNSEKYK